MRLDDRMETLYNSKYVYFDWDDKLEGKECFVAQDIVSLRSQVNDNPEAMVTLSRSNGDVCPFTYFCDGEITYDYLFAYYDPYYAVKKALLEGKDVQYYRKEFNEWTDLHLVCSVEDYLDNKDWDIYEWRIKPELRWHVVLSDEGTLGIAKSTNKPMYFTGDEEECIKWIDEHKGLIDIMKAWEEGKTIQYLHHDDWRDVAYNNPLWGLNDTYRIKPEPEYVPFDSVQELINAWDEKYPQNKNRPEGTMPLIWIKNKECSRVHLITDFFFERTFMGCDVGTSDYHFTLKELFEKYTFLDDSIIGKVKEE